MNVNFHVNAVTPIKAAKLYKDAGDQQLTLDIGEIEDRVIVFLMPEAAARIIEELRKFIPENYGAEPEHLAEANGDD